MQDDRPVWTILALTLPVLALSVMCCMFGGPVRDAVFAVLKLVVIR